MLQAREVSTYTDDELFWIDAIQVENVTPIAAWCALDPLLHRLGDIDSAETAAQVFHKIAPEAPLIAIGNEIATKASMLGGLLNVPMYLRIVDVQAGHYLRIAVTMLGQHFADIDFTIDPIDAEHVRLTYRQGFYPGSLFGWAGEHISLHPQEVPETLAIFDTWRRLCAVH